MLNNLPTHWRGHYWESLSSTQDAARAAAEAGAPSRSVFVTDFQSAGRGRHGRTWHAPTGTALLISLLLRQPGPPSLWRSTALASIALCDAMEALCPGLHAEIKWPNDVLIGGRKLAGILAESTWDGRQLNLIVGVGVNVTIERRDLEGLEMATSLLIETGQRVDRGALLRELLLRFDEWASKAEADVRAAWHARLWGKGQRLRLADVGSDQDVVVLGAEADGSLRVRLADGSERITATGELTL